MHPFLESLIRLFYPEFCALCRTALALHERYLCPVCSRKLEQAELPNLTAHQALDCGLIREYFFLYAYRDAFKDLWERVKFRHCDWLLPVFGPALRKFLLAVNLQTRYDYLVPVPMIFWRRVLRHYNQAELLASDLSRFCTIPVLAGLKKVRQTPTQHVLTRSQRRLNLRGSLAVCSRRKLVGRSVLLVDDIFTTGATARECARLMKQAGAKRVGFFALARTPALTPAGIRDRLS